MKIRSLIMLTLVTIIAVAFAWLYFRIETSVKPVYLYAIEDDLAESATFFSAILSKDATDPFKVPQEFVDAISRAHARSLDVQIYDISKSAVETGVYITDAQGFVVYHSGNPEKIGIDYSEWNDVKRTLEGEYGARATWLENESGELELVLHVASPVRVEGKLVAVVTAYKPTPVMYNIYKQAREEALFAILATVAFILVLAMVITNWVTLPIDRLTAYVQSVRDGKTVALPVVGSKELAKLAHAFEEMRVALEGKKYVEQYVQTLTHEIKSPLSAIRGAVELLDDKMPPEGRARFLKNIDLESARIQSIVERLLELSSLESRTGLRNREDVPLAEIVHETLDSLSPVVQARGLEVRFKEEKAFSVNGERFLLRLAVLNLIRNALEFSPPGGLIEIYFKRQALFVRDHGPGIPDYALPRIFERFYSLQRPDNGKKSSGLGLSIVNQIMVLHGGDVFLRNHPEAGALAELRFHN